MRLLHLYLDEQWVYMYELEVGNKWTTLVHIPTLTTTRVKNTFVVGQLAGRNSRTVGFAPRQTAKLIRETRAVMDRLEMRYSKKMVKRLLKELKALPKWVPA